MLFRKGDNIILIGMPAAGKSTAGVLLAKMMGYDFIDTDLLIQRRENARLEEIIARMGMDGFLGLEEDVCLSLQAKNTVIATGGSVVYESRAMEHLRATGVTVYLQIDWDTLSGRLHDIHGRGVVLREGQSLRELYEQRIALYERYADLIIDEKNMTLEETVRTVYREIGLINDVRGNYELQTSWEN